jgi:Uma2 family endonuclease
MRRPGRQPRAVFARGRVQGEADECYYVRNEALVRGKDEIDLQTTPPPDLAVEIEITSRWIDRRGIYADLGVPEIWSHDGKALRVYRLQKNGEYEIASASAAFPMLPMVELSRFLDQRSSLDETSLVRAFRDWVRERFQVR